jgi:predicted small metal-binding protein
MAGKTYHEVSCRDAGADCDFKVRAESVFLKAFTGL